MRTDNVLWAVRIPIQYDDAKNLNADGNQEMLVKRVIADGTAITERHVGMMRRLIGKATVRGLDVEIKPWNLAEVRNANMWIPLTLVSF